MFTIKPMKRMHGVDIYVGSIEEHIRQLEEAMTAYERATERFLYAVYLRFEEMLQKRGRAAKGVDYSKLELWDVGTVDRYRTFALIHPAAERDAEQDDSLHTLVYVRPKLTNDPDLDLLARYSPWPLEALPRPIDPKKATIISRRVTTSEVANRIEDLLAEEDAVQWLIDKGVVSQSKSSEGRKDQVLRRVLPPGWKMQEDIAWRVIRQEYGLGDEGAVPHWRSTLKDMQEDLVEECEAFMLYLLGDDDALKRTKLDGSGLQGQMPRIQWFQEMLGSVGKASREERARSR